MVHLKKICVYIVIICASLSLAGCQKQAAETSNNDEDVKCKVYLESLPAEYELLPDNVKDDATISFRLKNLATNKKVYVTLSGEEEFKKEIYMLPGSYEIGYCSWDDKNSTSLEVEPRNSEFKLIRGETKDIPLYVTNSEEFTQTMIMNRPTEEIQEMELFTRKMQYKGKIIDLNNIKEIYSFVYKEEKLLIPSERLEIPANDTKGISLIVQNQTSRAQDITEATVVGVHFRNSSVVAPQGVTLGMDISEVCHSETGLWGKPTSFTGSPFIGTGLSGTTVVYIDYLTGDKLSLVINPEERHIAEIIYEFEVYE